jgi:hypothetical protein
MVVTPPVRTSLRDLVSRERCSQIREAVGLVIRICLGCFDF